MLEDLTFGIEIEFLSPNKSNYDLANNLTAAGIKTEVQHYNHISCENWKMVTDGSISGGVGYELVSPILKGEDGLKQVSSAMKVLVENGCRVNSTCGFHVHVGNIPRNDAKFIKNILSIYAKYEDVFDSMFPASRRANTNEYCRTVKNCYDRVMSYDTVSRMIYAMGSRYYKLNIESLERHGTVEFRQHSGTLNSLKAISWIKLCLLMVETAKGDLPSYMTKYNENVYQNRNETHLHPLDTVYFPQRWTSNGSSRNAVNHIRQNLRNGNYRFEITQDQMNAVVHSCTWGSIAGIADLVGADRYETYRNGRIKVHVFIRNNPNATSASINEEPAPIFTFDNLMEQIKMPVFEAMYLRNRIDSFNNTTATE